MKTAVPEKYDPVPGIVMMPWGMSPPHDISFDHMIDICITGQKIYRSGDSCVKLCAGQFTVCCSDAQNVPSVLLTERERGLTIYIDTSKMSSLMSGLVDTSALSSALGRYCISDGCNVYKSDRIWEISKELSQTVKTDNICILRLTELMMILCETDPDTLSVPPEICTYQEFKAAETVFSYCMAHINEHISIESLAVYTGMSATRLKAACRNVYGMPLYSFIRKEKIYRAAEMLRTTDKRIIDIAADVGYDNPSKFAEAFRGIMGTSPIGHRRSV